MSLAGRERFSKQQIQGHKNVNPARKPINSIFLVGSVVVLFSSSFVIASSIISTLDDFISNSTYSPTSIPWINNNYDCKHSGRVWQDNKCWDEEHSPMF